MKKLDLYKSASDFALANFGAMEPAQLDIAIAEQFQKLNLDPRDYNYWKSTVMGLRNTFSQLNSQLAPSAAADANKPKVAPAPATAQ